MITKEKRNHPEDVLTQQVANYLRLLQRQGKIVLYTHVANEEPNKYRAFRNARLGLTSGVPDMLIVGTNGVLFLELKLEKGSTTSDNQKIWISALREIGLKNVDSGIYAEIAHGFTQAQKIIDQFAKLQVGK